MYSAALMPYLLGAREPARGFRNLGRGAQPDR